MGAEIVQSRSLLRQISLHGVSLARACLPVGEARYFGPFKRALNQGVNGLTVNLLVMLLLIEGIVEFERRFLDVLGQVDLEPSIKSHVLGLADDNLAAVVHRNYVVLVPLQFLLV